MLNLLLESPVISGVEVAIARTDAIGMSITASDLLPNWGKGQHEAAQTASKDTKLKLVQADTNNQPSPSVDKTPSTDSVPAVTEVFTNITADYWAYPLIQALAARNAIIGFPDGSFRPEQPVNRAELGTMLQKAFNPN